MKIDVYQFPDDLAYDATHNWARRDGDEVVQGLTDFGQALAGEIMFVEPVALGREVTQGQPLFAIESGKWVGRINAVISGTIVAVNDELQWEPDRVNRDPYGQGWILRIRPTALEEDWARLRSADSADFAELIAAERAKYNL